MNDPTANMVRAFEIRVGDTIVIPLDYTARVGAIEWIGGDEYGPAVWKFICNRRTWTYRGGTEHHIQTSYTVPYAALVKRL